MKNRQIMSLSSTLIVGVVLLIGSSASAMADTVTYKITVPSSDTHTYSVYQIFTGTLDTTTNTLSDIKAGQNFKTTATDRDGAAKTAAQAIEAAVTTGMTDQEKLALITPYVDLSSTAFNSVSKAAPLSVVPGYYLLKDSSVESGDAHTLYIVEVVKEVTVTRKSGVPTVEKKVQEKNDTTNVTSDWQDVADYDVNDTVPFQITGTLPENYDAYSTYKYVFTDTMCSGLTLDPSTITIMAGTSNITSAFTKSTTDHSFTLTCEDLKKVEGLTKDSTIVVTYSATLNSQATIGEAGNANAVYLTFSNNPNAGHESETTSTPNDVVKVYTYQVEITKVDKENKALAGAKFTLYKNINGTFTKVGSEVAGSGTGANVFTWSHLDAGEYKLEESTTPATYNTIKPVTFTIAATYNVDETDGSKTAIDTLTATITSDSDGSVTDAAEGAMVTAKDGGKVSASVKNIKGSILPTTGTTGLVILIGIAAALMVVVFCVRFRARRAS